MSTFRVKPKRVKDHRKYDPSLKREIARRYLAGEFSYRVAAEEYGLPNEDTAKEFVRWYRLQLRSDEAAVAGSVSGESPPPRPHPSARSTAELEEEIVKLRKVAHEAEAKAKTWRTVVRLACELTGEDLGKKFVPTLFKK